MNYTQSGFDDFLSRSIDNTPQQNLDSPGPMSSQIRYDASQVTGLQGDTFQAGPVRMTAKGIFMADSSGVDILIIGDDG